MVRLSYGRSERRLTLQFCCLIDACASLERAQIVSVECYRVRYRVVIHRFLVFHLQRRKGRSEVWLRVDRMGGKGVVRGGGVSPANDVVSLHHESTKSNPQLKKPTGKTRPKQYGSVARKRPRC